jgi:UDP-N-acetylglucosamine--N-acetylmuramyl-(pentapeptide) pyrophosphoryl-undecaprenol N-acetylglucosamine transferase
VPISGIKQRGVKGVFDFALAVPRAVVKLGTIFRALRPDVVVGVGGYVSVLPVVLGRLRGIPTWIHEAELKPGLANAFLSRFVDTISVAFAEAAFSRRSPVVYTGHPVRAGLVDVRRSVPRETLSRLLIVGGSQGATAIDRAVGDFAPFLAERNIEVWHQCRPENIGAVKQAYAASGIAARVDSFIDDIVAAFAWSDVVVSRSGASALMETSVVNIPTVFVPYPFAQANHQHANAEVLVRAGKALLVEEGEAFAARLSGALEDIFTPARYAEMVRAPYEARSVDAAARIARGIRELAGRT